MSTSPPTVAAQRDRLRSIIQAYHELPEAKRRELAAPYLGLGIALIARIAAPRALARLTCRARDAGFDVPELTVAQAAGLWRPAAFLLAVAACRAAAGAKLGWRHG